MTFLMNVYFLLDFFGPRKNQMNRLNTIWLATLIGLLQSQVHSSLKITNRSFQHAAPHVCNKLR